MSERFGYSRKEKKEIRESRQNAVEKDIREKANMEKMVKNDRYDPKIFDQGIIWFNEGMALEDGPENIRNNTNFINGYKKAERLAMIEEMKMNEEKSRGSR